MVNPPAICVKIPFLNQRIYSMITTNFVLTTYSTNEEKITELI